MKMSREMANYKTTANVSQNKSHSFVAGAVVMIIKAAPHGDAAAPAKFKEVGLDDSLKPA